ncbi:MAG TPA: hypothetical protein VFI43_10125 [Nitrosospira sp.]|nr:hypothetical protein [Nitrosospira sp.]
MMSRISIVLAASSVFFFAACASILPETPHSTEEEEVIRKKELPHPVVMALPKGYEEREFTYKRKLKEGLVSYDVYYEKGGNQFAITYDPQGKILEQERRIKLSDIPPATRKKIEKVLAARYPGYKTLMVEELYRNNEVLLEIFFSHPESKTGLVEAVFELHTGALREFINIKMKSIPTFN